METAGNAQGTEANGTSGNAAGGSGAGAQGGTQNGAGGESALVAAAAAAEAAKSADASKQTADPKAAAAKDAAKPLELKLPEGLDAKDPATTTAVENIKGLAKEAGLNAAQAQKVADAYFKAQEPLRAAQLQLEAERKAWPAELRADKEIGGANFDASMKLAGQALAQFGGKPLATLLQNHGLGDNPDVIRFCVRVGKALAEDSTAGTQNGAPPIPDAEAKLRTRYPTMFKDE